MRVLVLVMVCDTLRSTLREWRLNSHMTDVIGVCSKHLAMYAIASVSTHSFLSICPLLPHEVADPWVVMRLLDNECSPGCFIMDAREVAQDF